MTTQAFRAETSLGYTQITATTTSIGLGVIPDGCTLILIQAEAQAVRWRDDGVAPTATVGYRILANAELRYTAANAAALRFISEVVGGILNVTFYK